MPYDFTRERMQTNKELADEIAALTTLTSAQLEKLLPKKQDKEQLKELIKIVNAAASENTRIATLRTKMTKLGGVVFKILKTVI